MRRPGVAFILAVIGMCLATIMHGASAASAMLLAPCSATQSVSKTLGEKSVTQLPTGALFYRLESFTTLTAAQSAAGPLGVAAEASGTAWLLTLGPQGGASAGALVVAELGPLTIPSAQEYKLRLQQRVSQPGCEGEIHTHPGAEAWYLLAGEQTVISAAGQVRMVAGEGLVGPAPGSAMQLAYTGTAISDVLTFLVLDGAQPASTPATLPMPGLPATGEGYGAVRSEQRNRTMLLALITLVGSVALRRGFRRGGRRT